MDSNLHELAVADGILVVVTVARGWDRAPTGIRKKKKKEMENPNSIDDALDLLNPQQ